MTKAKFVILASNEATKPLLKTWHDFYEFRDKSGRLLAHQIRQSSLSMHITQIHTINGTTINT